jgi:hypothetical protein
MLEIPRNNPLPCLAKLYQLQSQMVLKKERSKQSHQRAFLPLVLKLLQYLVSLQVVRRNLRPKRLSNSQRQRKLLQRKLTLRQRLNFLALIHLVPRSLDLLKLLLLDPLFSVVPLLLLLHKALYLVLRQLVLHQFLAQSQVQQSKRVKLRKRKPRFLSLFRPPFSLKTLRQHHYLVPQINLQLPASSPKIPL